MMANSARDPYWHAAVRREVLDHPKRSAAIEDECSACHMPMARTTAKQAGSGGQIFAHLPVGPAATDDRAPGRRRRVVHGVPPDPAGEARDAGQLHRRLRRRAGAGPPGRRAVGSSGRFEIDRGLPDASCTRRRASTPAEAAHIQQSELCATCHTLYHAGARTRAARSSASCPSRCRTWSGCTARSRRQRSCQSCHMPEVEAPTPIASRARRAARRLSRHTFVGGNFFMLRMLNRYRDDLGVGRLPQELEAGGRRGPSATRSGARPRCRCVGASVGGAARRRCRRRESGRPQAADRLSVAPRVAARDGARPRGPRRVRVGRLRSERLDPGQRQRSRTPMPVRAALHGDSRSEDQCRSTSRSWSIRRARRPPACSGRAIREGQPAAAARVRQGDGARRHRGARRRRPAMPTSSAGRIACATRIVVERAAGPFRVEASLRYQPIAYRWAQNLKAYDAPEPQRFVRLLRLHGRRLVLGARARHCTDRLASGSLLRAQGSRLKAQG